jgi:molybdate transport system ATP-binding protein
MPVLYVTHSPSEAIALGSRLFFLDAGKLIAEGQPLDVLTSVRGRSFVHLEGVRNILPAVVDEHWPDYGATRLKMENGPSLIVPFVNHPPGTTVLVEVNADDILLARDLVTGLSARNVIAGVVERVIPHGPDAEVLVRTLGVTWIVSLVARAVDQLDLSPGQEVHMIIKARSCHVTARDGVASNPVTSPERGSC